MKRTVKAWASITRAGGIPRAAFSRVLAISPTKDGAATVGIDHAEHSLPAIVVRCVVTYYAPKRKSKSRAPAAPREG